MSQPLVKLGNVQYMYCRDKVHHLSLSTQDVVNSDSLAPLTATLPIELRKKMENFIAACYQVFSSPDQSFAVQGQASSA